MRFFELEIKKSRFFAYCLQTDDVEEVNKVFEELKKQNKRANHVCYGYKIVKNGVEYIKYFDDGEPNGTAGKPILSVIEKKNLQNIAVFVVRYFGGIKLGSGGLVRAYSKATSGVLS
jgi:uncharacterized YigZ family protein